MSSTTATLFLKQHERADKTRSLYLRITHNRKSAWIPMNIFITEEEWDDELQAIIKKTCKRYKDIDRINDQLQRKKLDARETITNLYHSGEIESYSVAEVKNAIVNTNENLTFKSFTERLVSEMKMAGKYGNAAIYETALNFVIKNNNDHDIKFQQINFHFLKQIEINHLAAGNTLNSLSVYLRTIRAIYNRAIKENVAKKDWYPFDKYSIKKSKTKKRAISRDDIKKIEDYQ